MKAFKCTCAYAYANIFFMLAADWLTHNLSIVVIALIYYTARIMCSITYCISQFNII